MCCKSMWDLPCKTLFQPFLMCYTSFRSFHGGGGSFHGKLPSTHNLGVDTMEIDLPGSRTPMNKPKRSIRESRYLTVLAFVVLYSHPLIS